MAAEVVAVVVDGAVVAAVTEVPARTRTAGQVVVATRAGGDHYPFDPSDRVVLALPTDLSASSSYPSRLLDIIATGMGKPCTLYRHSPHASPACRPFDV